jgi:hypothetical protein
MEWASVNRGLQKKLVELWVKERVKGNFAPFWREKAAAGQAAEVPGPEAAAAGQAGPEAEAQAARERGAAARGLAAFQGEEELEVELKDEDASLRFPRISAKDQPYEVEDLGIFPYEPEHRTRKS